MKSNQMKTNALSAPICAARTMDQVECAQDAGPKALRTLAGAQVLLAANAESTLLRFGHSADCQKAPPIASGDFQKVDTTHDPSDCEK